MPDAAVPSSDPLAVYTYATTATNPGPGGYAAVWRDGESPRHLSAHIEDSTTVRLAMLAIIDALQRVASSGRIRVLTGLKHIADAYTDGSVSEWRANDWQRTSARGGVVANADLWEALDDAVQRNASQIEIVHGLTKGPERDRCRKLANNARDVAEGWGSSAVT